MDLDSIREHSLKAASRLGYAVIGSNVLIRSEGERPFSRDANEADVPDRLRPHRI